MDYNEIVKRHLEKMNSNIIEDQEVIPHTRDSGMKHNPNMITIETKYKSHSSGSNIFTNIDICIYSIQVDKDVATHYGQFYNEWKEYIANVNGNLEVYWYNQNMSISTWENPLFIFLCLVENRINEALIPNRWEDIGDNRLKVEFSNHKPLVLNKLNKKLSNS
jgi:hypothetical protein